MTLEFPQEFLDRISVYPSEVQRSLKAVVDETTAQEILSVFHGPTSIAQKKIDGVIAQNLTVDAFVSRMLLSKKFQQRLSRIGQILESGSETAQQNLVQKFVSPLGNVNRPFVHKLSELISSLDPESPFFDELNMLLTLAAAQHSILESIESGKDCIVSEILAGSEGTSLLPCLVEVMGGPAGIRGAVDLPVGLSHEAGKNFLRQVLKGKNYAPINDVDAETLTHFIRDLGGIDGVLPLHAPQPMTVVLTKRRSPTTNPHWQELEETGLVEAVVTSAEHKKNDNDSLDQAILELPGNMPITPLQIALLRSLGPELSNLELNVGSGNQLSWAEHIVGYPAETPNVPIGKFRGPSSETVSAKSVEIFSALGDHNKQSQIIAAETMDAESCYAVLVDLDGKADLEVYKNVDRCLIVNGLDELNEKFADAPMSLQQKPVVLLDARSSHDADYVINAVRSYWAYSGRYPITSINLDYDGEEGRFLLAAADSPSLTHFALPGLTTLPFPLALALTADKEASGLESGFLLLPDELVVQDCGRCEPDAQFLTGLERSLNNASYLDTLHEAAFLNAQISYEALSKIVTVAHWPIAPIVRKEAAQITRLETALSKFEARPSTALANRVMNIVTRLKNVPYHLSTPLDDFAVRLAASPKMLLGMDNNFLLEFLRLARRTSSMDEIAGALALCCGDICRGDRSHILPLFEILACSLPADDLQAALGFAAADIDHQSKRAQYRIGEAIRRYGSLGTMRQHLILLKRKGSDLLAESGFVRFYQRLLFEDSLPIIETLVGKSVVEAIFETLDFKDNFLREVSAGNRNALLDMLSDQEATKKVEFIKWMDALRAHSNELYEMKLPVSGAAVSQLSSVYGNKLMATVFSDDTALQQLNAAGLLDDGTDLSLIARNILRDNAPLNKMLSERFETSEATPILIEGETAADVFANAAEATKDVQPVTNGPRVSVVMSAFNADLDLLKASLASVLGQSHQNVEVFVVDDASNRENSDALREAVDGLDRVTYFRLDENSGPYVGRNLAIEAATGDFIAIQDADDWSHPERFALQLEAFAASPTLQLVTTPHIRIDKYGRVQMEAGFSILGDGPMTSMFRKSAFESIGRFANVRSRGDVEMRERIRSYYGNHAMTELDLPMMLCFADSATLSQKTRSEKFEFLQLFRSNISNRSGLHNLRRAGLPLGSGDAVAVPLPLRPTS